MAYFYSEEGVMNQVKLTKLDRNRGRVMNDKQLIKEAMELAKQLDLGRSEHYADAILRLVQRFEELTPEPTSIVWEPKEGEKYYFITKEGAVNYTHWRGHQFDKDLLKQHKIYKTRHQAEKAVKHQKRYNIVLQAVLNLEPDQKVDWSDQNQNKYAIYFDHKGGLFRKSTTWRHEQGYPVLTEEKNVQPLLDYLNLKGGEW